MMRTILLGAAALLLAGTAQAQILGGNAHVGAGVSVPNPVPQTTQTVDRMGGDAMRTTTDTTRTATDAARVTADQAKETTAANARDAARVASANKPVKVEAGASIRVDRGTRCYYEIITTTPSIATDIIIVSAPARASRRRSRPTRTPDRHASAG